MSFRAGALSWRGWLIALLMVVAGGWGISVLRTETKTAAVLPGDVHPLSLASTQAMVASTQTDNEFLSRHGLPADIGVQRLDPGRWQAAGRHPLLNPDLVRIFEQLLGRGLPDAALDTQGLLAARIPAEYLAQAQALFARYQQYRDAFGIRQPPPAQETGRAGVLAAVLATRRALQEKYFTPAEVMGLFDDDNRYDAFTVERLRTEDRTDLNPAEKEVAVARLVSSLLTSEQQTTRQEAALPARITAQNLQLDQSGASAEIRQAERTLAFGAAAAARMADVDRQQAAWQARIARLAQATPEIQQKMRETEFTATERLRLAGALILYRAQQAKPAEQ